MTVALGCIYTSNLGRPTVWRVFAEPEPLAESIYLTDRVECRAVANAEPAVVDNDPSISRLVLIDGCEYSSSDEFSQLVVCILWVGLVAPVAA